MPRYSQASSRGFGLDCLAACFHRAGRMAFTQPLHEVHVSCTDTILTKGYDQGKMFPREGTMSAQILAWLVTVFVLGLFLGTNLGVLLMCLMRMASPDVEPEAEWSAVPLHAED